MKFLSSRQTWCFPFYFCLSLPFFLLLHFVFYVLRWEISTENYSSFTIHQRNWNLKTFLSRSWNWKCKNFLFSLQENSRKSFDHEFSLNPFVTAQLIQWGRINHGNTFLWKSMQIANLSFNQEHFVLKRGTTTSRYIQLDDIVKDLGGFLIEEERFCKIWVGFQMG